MRTKVCRLKKQHVLLCVVLVQRAGGRNARAQMLHLWPQHLPTHTGSLHWIAATSLITTSTSMLGYLVQCYKVAGYLARKLLHVSIF